MTFKIGDDYPVWWNTGRPKINGFYPATILDIDRYRGKYKEWFTHILKVTAPETKNGWVEISVNDRDIM